jgi:hypothetical protein
MYPRSAAFDTAIRDGQVTRTRIDVLENLAVIGSFTLKEISGTVSADRSAASRRRLSLRAVDSTGSLQTALSIYGREVKPYRGLDLSGGPEYLPLGVFGIEEETVDFTGDLVEVSAFDRSHTIAARLFVEPYVIAAGTNYGIAIQTLIASRMVGLTYSFVTTTRKTGPLVYDTGSDPWRAAMDLAASIGMELFFDADGVCVLRAEPDPSAAPVDWTYEEGAAAIVTDASKRASAANAYNGVIVVGESSSLGMPVRAEAWDDDPASPTYRLGPFGQRPYLARELVALIRSPTQAGIAAAAKLRSLLGTTESVPFSAIPHPAHELGDILAFSAGVISVTQALVSFQMPLEPEEELTGLARQVRPFVFFAEEDTGSGDLPADRYWMAGCDGGVFAFGEAPFQGSMAGTPLAADISGIERTSTGLGYWLVGEDGGVFAFGDAGFHGTASPGAGGAMIGIARTPSGDGYWLADDLGGVFAIGGATFHGSAAGPPAPVAPISGIVAHPSASGYWLVGEDGGVFAFGAAGFYGSVADITLNAPITGIAATATGNGYWLVGEDGGVFAFGDAGFYGSTGSLVLNQPVVDIQGTPSGKGYWFAAADGGVFSFGDAAFHGSTADLVLVCPVVGIA